MKIKFPSDAWIKSLSDKLNASTSYEQCSKNWEGDFTFVIEADSAYPQTAYLFLALYHGKSQGARQLAQPNEQPAPYILSAPFGTWRKVIEGRIDPIQGIMTKQLKLNGNMMMIMRYPKAAKEILECVKTIPTQFGEDGHG